MDFHGLDTEYQIPHNNAVFLTRIYTENTPENSEFSRTFKFKFSQLYIQVADFFIRKPFVYNLRFVHNFVQV